MSKQSQSSGFSIQLDGVKLGENALHAIGEKKLSWTRDDVAERSKLSGALAVYCGFVTVMNAVSSVVASVAEREDYMLNEPASRMIFGAVTAAATLFAYKYHREHKLAKSLDQAVVMLNGDTDTAKYKSTADELVKKSVFKKERIDNAVIYQRLTP